MSNPIRLDDLIDSVHNLHPGGTPLDHLSDAVLVSDRLGETADHLIGHFVDQARRSGATWTEIGASMGVTKQAAQKRFVPRDVATDFTTNGPFTRFTDRARRSVVAAQAGARAAGSPTVGTEHLLVGLLSEPDGFAAKALADAGATEQKILGAIAAEAQPPVDGLPEQIPFDTPAKKAIELTVREALRLGHNYVGTEHILLGLLAAPGTNAYRILADLGVTHEGTEAFVLAALERIVGQNR
ncbi:Clp protease N-terminal domain-containing protein [Tsukamurella sp. 8F]|uniref:Clp protease N-terminal domain-containing protein n=1 Tax=unclassified Tsukamurella TaxID=2633480 RepID=UPI0023B949D7|nr:MULTISPECIES: Clp protease N-terminal domain-containing protein [unclassified Tsukamurella]MDF0529519.1 Clp protease N-terminal domain-containing protein [Tsukamurella sp. 8J]MDF0585793.1 Clp protease N-terminal domain-containing protein [Tsukamurella sp. 8F]